MSNINKLGAILAVEDLTDAAAAVVEGGDSISGILNFEVRGSTKIFTVSRGGSVQFRASSRRGSSTSGAFTTALSNVDTGRTTPLRIVGLGQNERTSWTNVRGGTYRLRHSGLKGGGIVTGTYSIIST